MLRNLLSVFVAATLSLVGGVRAEAGDKLRGAEFVSGSARLVYYDVGPRDTVPLIVIAGGPGFDQSYLHIGDAFEKLAQRRRLVFFDQRGTGRASPFNAEDNVTVADYVGDVEALRIALDFGSVDVLGHSFGRYLAMAYAVEHPTHVRRLVLMDSVAPKRAATSFIFDEAFPERMDAYRAWDAAVDGGDVATATRDVNTYLAMLFYDPAKGKKWRELAASVKFNPIPAVLWKEPYGPDLSDRVRQLSTPVLVMTGRYDMNISARTAWEIHRALPHSEFLVFERSGHLPYYEEPDAFVDAVIEFLSD